MSKAVIASVRPLYCYYYAIGRKTLELRKTCPKLDGPFKVYIYCTQPSKAHQTICGCMVLNSDELYRHPKHGIKYGGSIERMCCDDEYSSDNFLNGKVIGEFVCDTILRNCEMANADIAEAQSCVKREKILEYSGGHEVFGWHVTNLKIYDKPKKLSEFMKPCICPEMPYCPTCPVGYEYISETEAEFYRVDGECSTEWICKNHLKRPPQSWCYVEDLGDKIANKEET